MKKEDYKNYKLHLEPSYPKFGVNTTIYDPLKIPKEVVIETNHITIKHKDLGFDIDVDTKQIEELHRIIINGVSFIREK